MSAPEYPYPPGKITTSQAVKFIATVVYPNDDQVAGRKRVREKIRYARQKKILPAADTFEPDNFFRWAIDANPDWADALVLVKGMPRAAIMMGGVSESRSESYLEAPPPIPSDPERLRDVYLQAETERMILLKENATLKQQLAECEAELNDWREKDRKHRAKLSEAGKKGGRGNFL